MYHFNRENNQIVENYQDKPTLSTYGIIYIIILFIVIFLLWVRKPLLDKITSMLKK